MDIKEISKEEIEQLKNCSTEEDVIELGRQYGIDITCEEARAALELAKENPEEFTAGDCDRKYECYGCKYFIHQKNTFHPYCIKDANNPVPLHWWTERCNDYIWAD